MKHPYDREGERRKLRPELRLAPDATLASDGSTTAREVLGKLGEAPCIEVKDEELGVDAVVVPAERYLELVTRLLEVEPPDIARDHTLFPPSLATMNVEQVNADASWDPFFRFKG